MTVIWRGSAAESQALVDAVEHNCTCEFWMDVRLTCCPACAKRNGRARMRHWLALKLVSYSP
jgi:hypothetical protein